MNPHKIFKFDKQSVIYKLLYEEDLGSKFKHCFKYLVDKMGSNRPPKDLSKLNWSKGKNYNWVCITDGNLTLIIRQYGHHFTIYVRNITERKHDTKTHKYTKYGCFTFHTNMEKISDNEKDIFYDNSFLAINKHLRDLIVFIKDDHIESLWNNYSYPREKYIEIGNIWNGGDTDISNIDDFIFTCEELFSKYHELYSEKEVFERIKTFTVGQMLDTYKIVSINTDLKDEYYHGVGLSLQNTNFPDSKPSWCDVYSLSRWYHEFIFPEYKEE